MSAEIDGLRARVKELEQQATERTREADDALLRERQRAGRFAVQAARLEAALRPFSRIPVSERTPDSADFVNVVVDGVQRQVTAGHFRQAAMALAGGDGALREIVTRAVGMAWDAGYRSTGAIKSNERGAIVERVLKGDPKAG